jgi:putative ABC transport system permease protein
MTVLGLLAGLAAALAAARVASGMLVGVGTGDPFTFLTVTFLVALVAIVASSIPALRASSVDPATAVRVD